MPQLWAEKPEGLAQGHTDTRRRAEKPTPGVALQSLALSVGPHGLGRRGSSRVGALPGARPVPREAERLLPREGWFCTAWRRPGSTPVGRRGTYPDTPTVRDMQRKLGTEAP